MLLGPSRGYVTKNLKKENDIDFFHYQLSENNYEKIVNFYNCLDAYLITSRQEGGPKGLLESIPARFQ